MATRPAGEPEPAATRPGGEPEPAAKWRRERSNRTVPGEIVARNMVRGEGKKEDEQEKEKTEKKRSKSNRTR